MAGAMATLRADGAAHVVDGLVALRVRGAEDALDHRVGRHLLEEGLHLGLHLGGARHLVVVQPQLELWQVPRGLAGRLAVGAEAFVAVRVAAEDVVEDVPGGRLEEGGVRRLAVLLHARREQLDHARLIIGTEHVGDLEPLLDGHERGGASAALVVAAEDLLPVVGVERLRRLLNAQLLALVAHLGEGEGEGEG